MMYFNVMIVYKYYVTLIVIFVRKKRPLKIHSVTPAWKGKQV